MSYCDEKGLDDIKRIVCDFEQKRESGIQSPYMTDSIVRNVLKHSREYSKIISCYAANADITLRQNRQWKGYVFKKIDVFWKCILCGLAILILGGILLAWFGKDNAAIGVGITAIVTFVSAFIVLPVTITQYLFNPNESKDLNEIVKSMQDYDYRMTHEDSADSKSNKVAPRNRSEKSDSSVG